MMFEAQLLLISFLCSIIKLRGVLNHSFELKPYMLLFYHHLIITLDFT